MKDPVCLGMCEHLLCRSCAGPRAGDGCVVCHSPAWVKDIQINRQLSSIIELFSGLEKLYTLSLICYRFNKTRNPRSRKIRCLVEKTSESTAPKNKPPGENVTMRKMSRLQAINQQWGITDGPAALTDQPCTEQPHKSGKRVSFGGPAVTSDKSHAPLPQRTTDELIPCTVTENVPGTVSNDQAFEPSTEIVDDFDQNRSPPSNEFKAGDNPDKKEETVVCSPAVKRSRSDQVVTMDTTPKRPRVSPGKRRPSAGRKVPCVLSSPSLPSPVGAKATRSPRVELGDSPSSSLGSVSRKSPRLSSGSPAVLKRNHKGETPLHIAAIKGDAEAVKKLLDQEADPNLKDNAGWTPLHEACNLGHLAVVEILVSRGALLNTPGYKNDSPLHDAVRNGHAAIVKLLLQLGASTNMPTTFNALLGVLAGCWVVKYSCKYYLFFQTKMCCYRFETKDESIKIICCTFTHAAAPLFDGCFFFLMGSFSSPPKEELTRLLRDGGGQILSRQPKPDSDVTQTLNQALCTQYILFDPHGPHKPAVVRRGKVWSAPSSWVIECIAAFGLLPVPEL
uniref:BRCA1 associated RING domain 1 n=1 Tax=Neogobius melanostomus TaxID=47308 RepID=A0A8C6T761_9GOBI